VFGAMRTERAFFLLFRLVYDYAFFLRPSPALYCSDQLEPSTKLACRGRYSGNLEREIEMPSELE
jgi:hypothetical protein